MTAPGEREPDDSEVDARFAEIVAHWNEPLAAPHRRRGNGEGATTTSAEPDGPSTLPGVPGVTGVTGVTGAPSGSIPTTGSIPTSGSMPSESTAQTGWRVGDASLPFIDGLAAVDGLRDAEDADQFEPGPTEPLPRWREDPRFWAMVAALLAGPLIVLYVVVVKPVDSGWLLLTGIGLTVAGFVLGVMRQPYRRDDDDNDLGIRL